MNKLKFIVLATGLVCLSLVGQMKADQCVVRKLTLGPALMANISVGYPEQYFSVLFNTGSSNTWVVSQNCSTEFCLSGNLYRSADSCTYLEDGRYWNSRLAMGALFEGRLSRDTIGLAGAFVADQPFGEALFSYGWVVDFLTFDGVLGLGSRFSPVAIAMDPIQSMYRQKLIPKQMFSLHVRKNEYDQVVGTAVLGGLDQEYFRGEITYVPIIDRWTFFVDYLTLPDSDVKHLIKSKASIDTTTNIILAPKKIVELMKTLSGTYDEPKTKMARWNSCDDVPIDDILITLVIDGSNMTLSAEDLVIKLEENGRQICYLAMHAHIEDNWLLGTAFLRKYYTVYDYDNKRVGFATSA